MSEELYFSCFYSEKIFLTTSVHFTAIFPRFVSYNDKLWFDFLIERSLIVVIVCRFFP